MTEPPLGGTFAMAPDLVVSRLGYGAMQLAGRGVFGPPRDRAAAVAVLREAVELGITHIDTSDFYGPHVTNQIIREALHPYSDGLHIVTKVGARRDDDGGWWPALTRAELRRAVHDNLRNLGVETLDVVNLRIMDGHGGSGPTSVTESFGALAELRDAGMIRHLGVSTVSAEQVTQAQAVAPVVCVQNAYNVVHRDDDDLIDVLAAQGIAYVPYFPLGGFSPLQSRTLDTLAARLGAAPATVALAWLLQRSPNVLPIPGTSSVAHLRENAAAAALTLSPQDVSDLDGLAA